MMAGAGAMMNSYLEGQTESLHLVSIPREATFQSILGMKDQMIESMGMWLKVTIINSNKKMM